MKTACQRLGAARRRSFLTGDARRISALVLLVLAAAGTVAVRAQRSETPRAEQVKAAFVVKFLSFVEWPETAPEEIFRVGVLGEGPVRAELESLDGRRVLGRRLEVRAFRDPEALERCHVLYLTSTLETPVVEAVLAALEGAPTLTVGDRDSFAAKGGMIGFYLEADRVRFVINLPAARAADLKISSKLLRLATVRREQEP